MYLKEINIQNFRGISNLSIEFEKDITVLIGENNTGKTTILEAVRHLTERTPSNNLVNFLVSDLSASLDDKEEDYLEINILGTFFIENSTSNDRKIRQKTKSIGIIDDMNNITVKLLITGIYKPEINAVDSAIHFLNGSNQIISSVNNSEIMTVRDLCPFFSIPAIRDPTKFFSSSKVWSSFLTEKDINESECDKFSTSLDKLYNEIFEAHDTFNPVCNEIKNLNQCMFDGNPITVTVNPKEANPYDVLKYQSQIQIQDATGLKIPLNQFGDGTKNLATLLLFKAYLNSRLSKGLQNPISNPIVGIEEPEAHLHPSAIQTTWSILSSFPGQKIVVTHSSDIISQVPYSSVRRLSKGNPEITCFQLNKLTFNTTELRKIMYHITNSRGSLYYARCWLLVEGETDAIIFPKSAELMGYNFFKLSIQTIAYSQVSHIPIIKLADYLGIPWIVITDGDDKGKKYFKQATEQLTKDRGCNPPNQKIIQLKENNIEYLLFKNGFAELYYNIIIEEKKHHPFTLKYTGKTWKDIVDSCKTNEEIEEKYEELYKAVTSKPEMARMVIEKMNQTGKDSIPEEIQDIISETVNLIKRRT